MKLLKHGDVMLFECEACGCRFIEAVSKTDLANAGVWNPKKQTHGARMECPDCGRDVIGYRRYEERANGKDRKNETDGNHQNQDGD